MTRQIELLTITAASIGFFHTLAGPDHYLPFIMMSKARRWSRVKTAWITIACGMGHVLSSVILGFIGIAFGIALKKLELIESFRGDLAAWFFTAFGFIYLIWGIRKAIKNTPHSHNHIYKKEKTNITPWLIFTIFIFGPCEPLIPLLMYPAARENVGGLLLVTSVFAITTIGTMLVAVISASLGFEQIPFWKLEKYTHAIAGGTIMICGLAITFLGL